MRQRGPGREKTRCRPRRRTERWSASPAYARKARVPGPQMPLRIAAERARSDASFGGPWYGVIARQAEKRLGLLRGGVRDPTGTHDPLAPSKHPEPGSAPPVPVADNWLIE